VVPPDSALARRVPEGQPAIAPALRNDWCTPDDVLVPAVYPILGELIGLDPCSNPNSLVRAEHSICLPEGTDETQMVGGLAVPWHKYRTFFCNPPFGDGIVNLWVLKAIEEAMLGAEGILLLPAYVSAYFFADIWNAAQVICFWGLPGVTNSRVKFGGAKDSATFPIMLVYFGPRVALAADVLSRVGQIVPPWVVQSWLYMLRGDVIPSLRDTVDAEGTLDPIYAAMRRACANQYDGLISACASVESKTLADLVEEDHPLIDRFLGLTAGEVAGGLSALQRVEPTPRELPTQRKPKRPPRPKKRSAEGSQEGDDPQLELVAPSTPAERKRQEVDRRFTKLIREYPDGLLSADLRERLQLSPSQFRSAVKRLTDSSVIFKQGKTTNTRYFPTRQ